MGRLKQVDIHKLEKAAVKAEASQDAVRMVAAAMGARVSDLLARAMDTYGTKSLTVEQQLRAALEYMLLMQRQPEYQVRFAEETLKDPYALMRLIVASMPKKLEVEVDHKPVIFLPAGMSEEDYLQRLADRRSSKTIDITPEEPSSAEPTE
jgi:hypothetical protein